MVNQRDLAGKLGRKAADGLPENLTGLIAIALLELQSTKGQGDVDIRAVD